MIKLTHNGLSQAEIETLFKMLEPFGIEESIEEFSDEYVSMISLDIPIAYNDKLFTIFGLDRWEELKNLFKNIKWRRGNKNVKITFYFHGNPDVEFSIVTASNIIMSKALDTIEYQVDNILSHIDKLKDARLISYRFDLNKYRWVINNISKDQNNNSKEL